MMPLLLLGLKFFLLFLCAAAIGFAVAWFVRRQRIREMYQSIRSLESDTARLGKDLRHAQKRAHANRIAHETAQLALNRERAETSALGIELDAQRAALRQATNRAAALEREVKRQQRLSTELEQLRQQLLQDEARNRQLQQALLLADNGLVLRDRQAQARREQLADQAAIAGERDEARRANAQAANRADEQGRQLHALQAMLAQTKSDGEQQYQQLVAAHRSETSELKRALESSREALEREGARSRDLQQKQQSMRIELEAAKQGRGGLSGTSPEISPDTDNVSAHTKNSTQRNVSAHTDADGPMASAGPHQNRPFEQSSQGPAAASANRAAPAELPPDAAPAAKPEQAPRTRACIRPPRQYLRQPEQVDELRRVHGIGHRVQPLLYSVGVYQFRQVASWSDEDIEYFDRLLKMHGRIERERWVETAAQAHQQKYGEALVWDDNSPEPDQDSAKP